MKMSRILTVGCLFGAMVQLSLGQNPETLSDYPPPTPPLVTPVPTFGQWTITLGYPDEDASKVSGKPSAKPKHRLHQLVATKTENRKRDVMVYDDGKTEEYWYADNMALIPESSDQPIVVAPLSEVARATAGEGGNPIISGGFTGLDWVQQKYYVGAVMKQQVPCYHYIFGDKSSGVEAWINAKTGLPVAYLADGITYTYAFGSAPSSSLELPAAYASALKDYQQIQKRRELMQKELLGH